MPFENPCPTCGSPDPKRHPAVKSHVFVVRGQPAARYSVQLGDTAIWIKTPMNRAIRADCCGYRRLARNLIVQVYYDSQRYLCVRGKGCKKVKP